MILAVRYTSSQPSYSTKILVKQTKRRLTIPLAGYFFAEPWYVARAEGLTGTLPFPPFIEPALDPPAEPAALPEPAAPVVSGDAGAVALPDREDDPPVWIED